MIVLKKEWEGKMGNSLTPTWIIFVDGQEVGFSKRKWLAQAIGEAVAAGHIPPTGDTTARFAQWAFTNDPKMFERIGNSV